MADHHAPVEIDPKQLETTRHTWHITTQFGKWTVVFCAVVLAGLALAFVQW